MPSILDDRVELRHLRYFRALAEAESFTRAAAAIGLKQPTLSHQIQQLEDALGAELVHRGRNLCRLTPAGEILLPHVQRVLGEMEALRQALDDQSGLKRGSLSIAVLPVLAERVAAHAVAGFHQAHPAIQVRLLEMTVDEMARALSAGSVDLCIGSVVTSAGTLKEEPLFEEELVAVVAPAMAASRSTIALSELAAFPVMVPPAGFGTRTLILQAWAKARRAPVFAMEANSTEVVLKAVAAGGGVGVLPASALWGRDPDRWAVLRIQRPVLRRTISVYHARVVRRRPAAEAMIPLLWSAVRAAARHSPGPAGAVTLLVP